MNIPYGYVYRIRNKINGKTYVGQRKLSLDKRWRQYMGSGVAVKAAIAKYGSDSFAKELVAYASTYDELNEIEVKLILEERAAGKAQYNLHIGSPVPKDIQPFKNFTPAEKKAVFEAIAHQTRKRYRRQYEEAIRGKEEVILSLYAEYRSCKKVADHLKLSVTHVNRFVKESGTTLNYQAVKGRVLGEEEKKRISEGRKHSIIRFKHKCQICQSPFESKSNKAQQCPDCFLLPTTTAPNCIDKSGESSGVAKITATCSQCNQEFETVRVEAKFCSKPCFGKSIRKPLPPIEVIERLYWVEKLSANEIGRRFGVSGQTIRKFMRKNNVDRRDRNHS